MTILLLKKASEVPYQALWIEVIVPKKKNIFCSILYRQHNNPDRFLKYIDDKLEFYTSKGNPVFVLTDSNIDLLRINSCNYAHDFLLSLQSCSMLPTIDKPTRIYRDSATLIDNIFVNNFNDLVLSGNVITDLSDHFSQFCIMHSTLTKNRLHCSKIRDYSRYDEASFNKDISQIDWQALLAQASNDPNKQFSTFYNRLNKLVNKHAPLKRLSKRKSKQFKKPWITKGIKIAIRKKNEYFIANKHDKYILYRNSIRSLTRASKKLYYQSFFNQNLSNMKKT